MAQSKVTKVEEKTYQGKVTGHSIELSDGVKGYLDDKGSDKDIKEGETVDYLVSVKQNKKGENYNLLTLKRAGTAQTPALPKGDTPHATVPPELQGGLNALKIEMLVPIARIVMDGVISGKIESSLKEYREWYNGIVDDVFASIDEIKG